jgi:hypothetical protein
MKRFIRLLLIAVVIIIFCEIDQSFGNSIIETQIGPFNLAGPPLTESKLVSQFGEGYVQLEKIGDKIVRKKRIFWVPEQEVWVQIDLSHVLDEKMESAVEAVLVTKKKLCDQDMKYIPQKTLGLLATSKGIKIKDPIEKVIGKYGKPSISMTVGKDKIFTVLGEELKLKEGLVLRYLQKQPSSELNFAEFYFKQKKLHSLLISESE